VAHCSTLQHTTTHCNLLQQKISRLGQPSAWIATPCCTLQRIAAHCGTLQRTATHCNTMEIDDFGLRTRRHTTTCMRSTHCNTLRHTATHCNTLQTLACTTIVVVEKRNSQVLHCVTVHCSVLHCVAVCYSVLQCVAMGCSVAHYVTVCGSAICGKYMIHVIICEHRNHEH